MTRRANDFYATPAWVVQRLLDAVAIKLPIGGRYLDPCAGDGAIIRALPEKDWSAIELRLEAREDLLISLGGREDQLWCPRNALTQELVINHDVIITNPPFSLAMEFIERYWYKAEQSFWLVRLGFLASEERSTFMRMRTPDVFILPNRPSFTEDGKTDSSEYCWLRFARGKKTGKIKWLNSTPVEERV